jgi:hypothetical protein
MASHPVSALGAAKSANPLFAGAIASDDAPNLLGVIFTRETVQFFNDDLSDVYGNFNQIARDVFGTLLKSNLNTVEARFGTLPAGAIPQLIPSSNLSTVLLRGMRRSPAQQRH